MGKKKYLNLRQNQTWNLLLEGNYKQLNQFKKLSYTATPSCGPFCSNARADWLTVSAKVQIFLMKSNNLDLIQLHFRNATLL